MEVWVTGAGCLCAAGTNAEESWAVLLKGGQAPPEAPPRLLQAAADLGLEEMSKPAFSLPENIFAGNFRHSARDTLTLAEIAACEAIEQAELSKTDFQGDDVGIIIGSTAGNALHFLEDYAALKNKLPVKGAGVRDFFECSPALALAEKLEISGPAFTIGNACCSGADAIGLGFDLIRSGRCRRIIAGGADALSLVPYIGFSRLMIYSDQPCKPFDLNRSGLNLGEGAGVLILESAEEAEKRQARPLARLASYGVAADAHHLTAPHPEGRGLRAAIKAALSGSGLSPADLAFVNAHGTATPDNDRVEALALAAELPGLPLWGLKGSTGHTLGAAGAIEAVLSIMGLRAGQVPPSHGFSDPDPALGLTPWAGPVQGNAAISLSLGFGGGSSALIFREL